MCHTSYTRGSRILSDPISTLYVVMGHIVQVRRAQIQLAIFLQHPLLSDKRSVLSAISVVSEHEQDAKEYTYGTQ